MTQFFEHDEQIPTVHFVLLMPSSGSWDIGLRIAGAAALAVERVNADKALLPGRRFEYSWADSGCSAQKALKEMGDLLRKASKVDAVIGPGCSTACKVTSYLSSGQEIPQISWACASPKLSDKDQYRLVSFLNRVPSLYYAMCFEWWGL